MDTTPKVVRISTRNFWPGHDPSKMRIVDILRKNGFTVEICDAADADYLIASCYREYYQYLEAGSQVRIMCSGENYVPDFNLVDYAYSPYPIQFYDRHFHFPQGLHRKALNDYMVKRSTGEIRFDQEWLSGKTIFANFCASHESENNFRGDFFKRLCQYKKVDSIGTYLNNTGVVVNWKDSSKRDYQRKCKFTLCFESTAHDGFNTEKIVDAFCSDTIPIYFGDPHIGDIYNTKAFVNVSNYPSVESAIQAIIALDQDDQKYLDMMNQPVLKDPTLPSRLDTDFERWILHIFKQPIDQAYRRSRVFQSKGHEDRLLYWLRLSRPFDKLHAMLKKIKRRLRRSK